MIVHAAHPALMLRVPPRARNVRIDWQRTVTPVEVAAASAGDLRPVEGLSLTLGGAPEAIALSLFEGRLFTPLRGSGRAATAGDLAALLEGTGPRGASEADVAFHESIRHRLTDSPLILAYRGTPRYLPVAPADDRGDALGPPRLVRYDGQAEASANATAYARDDLLLVDGIPYVRVVPLARVFRDDNGVHARIMSYGGMASLGTAPVAPADFDAATRATAEPGRRRVHLPDGFDAWQALPASVFGERARETVANCLPGLLRMTLDRADASLRPYMDPAWRRTMAEWETRGLNRSLAGEPAGDALRDSLQVMAALIHFDRNKTIMGMGHWSDVALAMLREVHVAGPGHPAPAPPAADSLDEDAAAFAGI